LTSSFPLSYTIRKDRCYNFYPFEVTNLHQRILMLRTYALLLLLVALLLPAPSFGQEDEAIGGLRKVHGTGTVLRQGQVLKALDGLGIHSGDTLRTGKDGRMGIIFIDNTRISLGPDSEITIDRYIYKPQEKKFSFLTGIAQGTASYLSGLMAKLAPDAVQVQTPTATVGIRGTYFLIQVDPPQHGQAK
jgi:hypothetical protein